MLRQAFLFTALLALGIGIFGERLKPAVDADRAAVTTSSNQLSQGYLTGFADLAEEIRAALLVSEQLPDQNPIVGAIIPHHLPTALTLMARQYQRLAANRGTLTRLIIIGPDHRDLASHPLVTTRGHYQTPFGVMAIDEAAVSRLTSNQSVRLEMLPFQGEHAIGAQALVARSAFPEATLVPILIRSSATVAEAVALGQALAPLIDEGTVVVASVDFSHYYPLSQARALDEASARYLADGTLAALRLVRSDSTQSLVALATAMALKGAPTFVVSEVENSASSSGNEDWTTGYVTGVYQAKKS